VILLPGHTPGSAALHFATHDAVCIGDAIATYSVTTGIDQPRIAPFTADPAQALDSLTRLDGLDARLVLPGHGQAWTGGLGEALRVVREAAVPR
jgi:glyoxylase-like metal-dependent hydrolase (beta-lactamase superfamily II)